VLQVQLSVIVAEADVLLKKLLQLRVEPAWLDTVEAFDRAPSPSAACIHAVTEAAHRRTATRIT
jgi:hypothetical protein